MIWRTAKSTDVNSRHIPYPIRASGRSGRTVGRGRPRRPAVLAMAVAPRRRRAPGRTAAAADEGRVEVVLQVLEVLEPDRHAQQTGRDAGGQQLGLGQLALRGRRRVDDHRVDAPERGRQLGQAAGLDDRPAGLAAAGDLEGEHAAGDAPAGTGGAATSCCGWLARPG